MKIVGGGGRHLEGQPAMVKPALALPEAALPASQLPSTSNRASSPWDAPWNLCSVAGMTVWGATSGDPHPGYL